MSELCFEQRVLNWSVDVSCLLFWVGEMTQSLRIINNSSNTRSFSCWWEIGFLFYFQNFENGFISCQADRLCHWTFVNFVTFIHQTQIRINSVEKYEKLYFVWNLVLFCDDFVPFQRFSTYRCSKYQKGIVQRFYLLLLCGPIRNEENDSESSQITIIKIDVRSPRFSFKKANEFD